MMRCRTGYSCATLRAWWHPDFGHPEAFSFRRFGTGIAAPSGAFAVDCAASNWHNSGTNCLLLARPSGTGASFI